MKNPVKRFGYSFLAGIAFGAIVTGWLAPRLIAWYFEPPVEIGVNCRPAVEWAMERLQWAQLIGAFLGGILISILVKLLTRRSSGSMPTRL